MDPVRPRPLHAILFLLPVLGMLVLCFLSLNRSRPGPWHDKAKEFWHAKKWRELQALAENLHQTGDSDAECLYYAMMASAESENQEKVRIFGSRLAGQKLLNWRIEQQLSRLYHPQEPLKRIAKYRTRAFLVISLFLTICLSLSFRSPKKYLPWISVLSTVGCLLLVL